ncbi:MAG: hypothetical protein GX447_06535, partial [Elusimicrobia bacterium]|nr:hypothetical protein [Elusimicrobiota bacterium]
ELALSTHTIRDCGDKSKEECLWCAGEGYPCNRPSQKQYEYLKSYGKITDNIEEIKPGDILFFKECAKEESCPIVHVMFARSKSEDNEKLQQKQEEKEKNELKCTQEICPVSTISTSKGRRIKKEDKFVLKKGCYEYGCKKYDEEKEKCIERKKQCFVGGGRP